ncbi:hypothetical protein TYRP_006520 [Tyrophagus putrescentiae]|nr:hypothetical protein TYRP_006520 [Tyrophagus putrescentiae]
MSHVLNCSNRSRNYKLQGSQVLKSSPPERRMTFRQPSLPALLPHQLTCNHMPSSHVIYNDFSHHYPHYHHFLPLFLLLLIVNTAPVCLPHPLPKEATPTAADELPHFSKPIGNQTAVLGRSTVLECSVDNLGPFNKVAWLKMDSSGSEPTVLTIGTQTLFNENKYRVSQNGHRQWYLHIKHIRVSDKGGYMCQVNAKTMISQVGYLHVQVPPIIIEDRTSSDTTVDEHQKAVLKCVAKGYPRPKISWRREDGQPINLGLAFGGKKNTAPSFEGDQLNLTQVTREDMGAYLCIASNGVPPSLSKRILLHVNFRPKIKVQKQLVNAHLGDSVELVCHCEAYPKPLVTWITPSGTPVIASTLQQSTSLNFSSSLSSSFSASTSSKYEIEEDSQGYRTTMKLKISTISTEDFGGWKCLSKNTLGEKEGLIRLFAAAAAAAEGQLRFWNSLACGNVVVDSCLYSTVINLLVVTPMQLMK